MAIDTLTATIRPISIELPGRVRLEYVEQGDPMGIPVVLLHGVTDSWHSFEEVLPLLPASLHAFAVTQRGHGDSDRPETGYRLADFSADLAAFMDAVGLEAAVIVGHSMGAFVAQRFAIEHPERTLGILLEATFHSFRANPAVVEFCGLVAELTDPIDPAFAREFQQSTLARPMSPALFKTAMGESLKVPARIWRAAFAGFLADDVAGDLARIEAPTLILWGDQDAFSPHGDQETLATAIPDARLVVYAGAGHAFHWEDPKQYAADLTTFTQYVTR
ncbi:MAG: alpha/beta fold hydrolase [Thermomicrobiales bacterium]